MFHFLSSAQTFLISYFFVYQREILSQHVIADVHAVFFSYFTVTKSALVDIKRNVKHFDKYLFIYFDLKLDLKIY
jgi:hypothetical protein